MFIQKLKSVLSAFGTFCILVRREATEWFRAFLRAIPGEVGCWARRRFYGFRSGPGTRVLGGVIIYHPRNLVMGRSVGVASHCQINAGGGVEIGDAVLIGPGTMIWSQTHKYNNSDILIINQDYTINKIFIDDDVWIGSGAIILPGVHLARGTVVAAGAVVTKSTEPYTLVAGLPAKILGRRTPGGTTASP